MMQPLQFYLQDLLGEAVQILLLLVGLGTSVCSSKARDLNEEKLKYALGIDEKGESQENMMQPLQFCLQDLLGEVVQMLLLLVGLGTSVCCSKARDLNEEELRYALGIDEKG
ncbi:hypothetical protein OESDEN_14217 [Oesophagostomum dentatum]|uniref:Uncharacterized protein n=1 Tax=Oesophagostomum dentatum TaxID=61180 RepID=A0A0B1SS61_OESDE|nr:hypothetical protein OESDEN_14217 [Oesophagostomum dentatum]